MSKFLSVAALAALGLTLFVTDAHAFGFRKKNKGGNCCSQGGTVAYGGYGYGGGYGGGGCCSTGYGYGGVYAAGYGGSGYGGGCCSTGYGMVGQTGMYYGQSGQPGMYYTQSGQPGAVAMPMAPMPGTAGTTTAGRDPTHGTVTVLVPAADAEVWFEETPLPQTGKERTFKTPSLNDNNTHTYKVKARWTANGKPVEKVIPVNVKAGEAATADFR